MSMNRSRWLDWIPRTAQSCAGNQPTKPSKPGSVGFVGPTVAETPEIGAPQDSAMPCPTNSEDEPAGVPWAEWKAAELNRLFQLQGVMGDLGRITAATVRDGERKERASHNKGKDTQ